MLTSYPLTVAGDSLSLWQEYRQTRDRALRDRLILTYAPLVKFVAGRLGATLPSHVDEQDLVSYGLLGLIGAIERFDPGREIKFETYAIARIKGAIIDELRSLDWVPRSVRTRAREIERAIAEPERQPDRRHGDHPCPSPGQRRQDAYRPEPKGESREQEPESTTLHEPRLHSCTNPGA